MKNKLFLYLFSALLIAGCKSNSVRITGTILNPVNGTYLYLDELKSNKLNSIDSVKLSDNGSFSFKTEILQPSFYLLKSNEQNFLTMLIAPGEKITIKAKHDSLSSPVSLEGSAGTRLLNQYNMKLRATIRKLNGLTAIYNQNADKPDLPKVMNSLDSLAQLYLNEINAYTRSYIDENLTSLASLVALYQQVAPSVYILNPAKDMKYFLKVDSSMFKLYPDYEPVLALHEQVKEIAASMTGSDSTAAATSTSGTEAPDISLPNPEGDTIKLSSTRGSVVLLDFWASWCSPCRKESPNLVNVYNMYHKRGFQIYQVSLDKTREAWIQGIQDDHLERWIHVSDVQYWNSSVVPLYRIESIPTNYLLDRNGHVIASNLRGERLETKLAEIFK